jgi:hypothetical protein
MHPPLSAADVTGRDPKECFCCKCLGTGKRGGKEQHLDSSEKGLSLEAGLKEVGPSVIVWAEFLAPHTNLRQ